VNINKKLRELRIAADLTQHELARISGVPYATLAQIETYRHQPTMNTVTALLAVYGLCVEPPLDDLLTEMREWSREEIGSMRYAKTIKRWETFCTAVARVGWTVELVEA
jgi:DNA-binding XRE family transcriptional regulator